MSELLSEHVRDEIDRWTARFPEGKQRSAVISALHAVQHENGGYLIGVFRHPEFRLPEYGVFR